MTRRPAPRNLLSIELPPDLAAYLAQRARHQCMSKAGFVRSLIVADRDAQQQAAAARVA